MPSPCPTCGAPMQSYRGKRRCPACQPASERRAQPKGTPPRTEGHQEGCSCFRCHYGEEAYQNWVASGFTARRTWSGFRRPETGEPMVPVDTHGVALVDVPEAGIEEGTVLASVRDYCDKLYARRQPGEPIFTDEERTLIREKIDELQLQLIGARARHPSAN